MKTKTDFMELICLICDFYNTYREILGLTHEDAKKRAEYFYNDLFDWVYEKGDFNKWKIQHTTIYANYGKYSCCSISTLSYLWE